MAATVIDNYSTEVAQGNPPNYAPLKPNQHSGRVRVAAFTRVYVTESAGDDTALCILPKGARIIGGYACVDATTGTATLSFGIAAKDGTGVIDASSTSDSKTFFKAAAAITDTAKVDLCATQALNFLYETQKEVYVTVTTAAASMSNQTLKGCIMYVVD
jgi:hypothetical protein